MVSSLIFCYAQARIWKFAADTATGRAVLKFLAVIADKYFISCIGKPTARKKRIVGRKLVKQ